MSTDISKFRIAAALAVAAFMLVVPLAVCFDSDAEIAEDSAGYYVEGNEKASDAELTAVGLTDKNAIGNTCTVFVSGFFNPEILSAPVTEIKEFTVYMATGEEVGEAYSETVGASGIDVKDVKITFTLSAGKLMDDVDPDAPEVAKEAVDAVSAYFGENASAGDKLVITGDFSMEIANLARTDFARSSDTQLVREKVKNTAYTVMDIDYTIELIKAGDESGKTIKFRISEEGSGTSTVTYTYDKDVKDLINTDKCKKKTHESVSGSEGATVTVDGTDYKINEPMKADPDKEKEELVQFVSDSTIAIDPAWKAGIDSMTGSDNTEVKKGYSAAESAYNDVKQKVDGKKTNYLPFIIGGVVAVVIIAGVAFFLIKRK